MKVCQSAFRFAYKDWFVFMCMNNNANDDCHSIIGYRKLINQQNLYWITDVPTFAILEIDEVAVEVKCWETRFKSHVETNSPSDQGITMFVLLTAKVVNFPLVDFLVQILPHQKISSQREKHENKTIYRTFIGLFLSMMHSMLLFSIQERAD